MKKLFFLFLAASTLVVTSCQPDDHIEKDKLVKLSGGGLVAHYTFDGNVKDISGNNNNGQLPSVGVGFTEGKFVGGEAAKFTSASHIRIPNSESLKFDKEASFSIWVKTTSNNNQAIFAKKHDTNGLVAMAKYTDDKLSVAFSNNNMNTSSAPKFGIDASINNSTKNWVHVVYVVSQNTLKVYLNGILSEIRVNQIVDFSLSNENDLYIGKFYDTWYPFIGSIDDFRIYNRALKEAEVTTLYTNEK